MELYGIFGIGSSASRTKTIEVLLDVIPAKPTDLVSTRTRLEVLVCKINLLHALAVNCKYEWAI